MAAAASDPHEAQPVTVTVARRVAPGQEARFERWAERLTRAAAKFPGFLGAGLLRPGRVGQDWHVVYRFDRADHLAAWESSDVRGSLLAAGDDVMETIGVQRISGLETWFELPGRTAPAPPRWKMFLVSVATIYLLQVLVYTALGGLTTGWPMVARLALFVCLVTAAMTWLVMPRVARWLSRWLYADPA